MIGETCAIAGSQAALTLRTEPSCGSVLVTVLQPRVGKHQMYRPGNPHMLLQTTSGLGKPIVTTGQAPIALALCEVGSRSTKLVFTL